MAAEEDQSGGMVARLSNLNIEMAGTEEQAAEGLAAALEMEVERTGGAMVRTRDWGLKGHWVPLNSSLRKLSRAEILSFMPVMGLAS